MRELEANWVWTPGWVNSSARNTAGRFVTFTFTFTSTFGLPSEATGARLHVPADTRYKLYVNDARVAVGPVRSSPSMWYHDTIDAAPYLVRGQNEIRFVVLRYYASLRAAAPFERTSTPGFTVVGSVECESASVDLAARCGWEGTSFPTDRAEDGSLHVSILIPFSHDARRRLAGVPIWAAHPTASSSKQEATRQPTCGGRSGQLRALAWSSG